MRKSTVGGQLCTSSGTCSFCSEVCNKAFGQQNHLMRHKQMRSGEQPFSCDMCNKEMRWIGTRIMDEGRHVIFYSGHHKKHEFGVGFLVNNRIKDSIIGFIPINHMLCIARIAGIFFNYSIINAHAPVEDADDEEKDDFYDALAKAYKECPRHDIKVLVRDMNAQVGRDSICEPNIGRHDLCDDTNGDGSHVVDFALTHNLVGRTLFIPKKIHKGSRRTPNGNAINQIDRTLTDARRQVRSAACESI